MTKKRYQKLLRAYLTRLNEWAKSENGKMCGSTPMPMGRVYKAVANLKPTGTVNYGQAWAGLSKVGVFGVGAKTK